MSTAPTVGRIVHYRSYGTPGGKYAPECRAALVTEDNEQVTAAFGNDVGETAVSLAVHNPTGTFYNRGVEQDETKSEGDTWHWPCVRTDS